MVQQQDSLIARWGVESIRGQFLILTALTVAIWGLESMFEYAYDVILAQPGPVDSNGPAH